jgi:hypothetical protein
MGSFFCVFRTASGDLKKVDTKFLNLTNSLTFAFPKKTVDQCDK